jgi:hypothetical protein
MRSDGPPADPPDRIGQDLLVDNPDEER